MGVAHPARINSRPTFPMVEGSVGRTRRLPDEPPLFRKEFIPEESEAHLTPVMLAYFTPACSSNHGRASDGSSGGSNK